VGEKEEIEAEEEWRKEKHTEIIHESMNKQVQLHPPTNDNNCRGLLKKPPRT
jgi:hypothetical protein